jgi:hypothetical protein
MALRPLGYGPFVCVTEQRQLVSHHSHST